MHCTTSSIPFDQIGYFSRIIVDYLKESDHLKTFYRYPLSVEGLRKSILARKNFNTNRKLLAEVLYKQYKNLAPSNKVLANIQQLLDENTFTIVTAHQPNIFTGYLYFIYKILHVIRLAEFSAKAFPEYKFVPVYYMGSEDADLEELGNISMNGDKLVWQTDQKGAVGRMNTKGLEKIIARIEGELSVLPFGNELLGLLKSCYIDEGDVQTATFKLVHALFQEYGLIVVIPDNADFKRCMYTIFQDDLLNQTPSAVVEQSIQQLSQFYKIQATPREINLFYLKDNIRERFIKSGNDWKVVGQNIRFTEAELMQELNDHPERFSPNVILRGLYQETILPNIAFVGGGGETAYWLELAELFAHYGVPFPVLILRNSFLFINKGEKEKIDKLQLNITDIFREERLLVEDLVKRNSSQQLDLTKEIDGAVTFYDQLKEVAVKTDSSLSRHVESLKTRSVNHLRELEKKMLKAEKRKFNDQQRQIHSLKTRLFPNNGLQERVENFMPYYAEYGEEFIRMLYENSPALDQHFVVLTEV